MASPSGSKPDLRLAGQRLSLRLLRDDDVGPEYLGWLNDPDVNRYLETRFAVNTLASLREYVSATRRTPDVHLFAIVLGDGRHIGNIKLGPVEDLHGRAEIGIMIGERSCWGKGYATDAIELLSQWAFGQLGLRKLTAGAYAPNVGSIRAFERAGFHVEARRTAHFSCDGAYVDAVLMARFADGPPRPR